MRKHLGDFSLLLLGALAWVWESPSYAETIEAATCSYADVSTAIAAAGWGDTVTVPECDVDWGDDTLVITKGLTLHGAGRDKTIISASRSSYSTSSALIAFDADETTASSDHAFELDGFHLKAGGTHPPYALLRLTNSHSSNHLTKVVISNNTFQQLAESGSSCMAILLDTAVFGVAHSNEIIDGSHAWRFLGNLPTGKTVVPWEPGSAHAMYFEDNFVHISKAWSTSMIISGGGGNRYVSRYNTFDLSANGPNAFTQAHDIHGNQPNNPGAGIGFEAYGEHRMGGSGRWFDQRGGRVHFFMNRWSATAGAGGYFVWEEFDDDTFVPTSCEGLSYPTTSGGINCLQRARDSYYWRNFTGVDGTDLVTSLEVSFDHFDRFSDPPTVNDPLLLFENGTWWRDNAASFTGLVDPVGSCGFYEGPRCTKSGIGCGTLGEMQAIEPCSEGVGFWVTDQGNCDDVSEYVGHDHTKNIEGTLYKCTSSGEWESFYTPYAYPHPLRHGAGPDGDADADGDGDGGGDGDGDDDADVGADGDVDGDSDADGDEGRDAGGDARGDGDASNGGCGGCSVFSRGDSQSRAGGLFVERLLHL